MPMLCQNMASPATTTVLWAGVCHTISMTDARILVRSGMATPSRRYPGSYSGLVYATSEYRTPGEALEVLARRPSAVGLAREAANRQGPAASAESRVAAGRGAWR
jgi:hypothetical protein